MRLFQINTTVNTGSTGRIAEDIGLYIIKQGGESMIAYGRKAKRSNSKTYKIGGKLDQINHLVQTRLFDTHGFHSNNSTVELIKQIESFDPDVIHLHNLHGYYLNVEILFDFLKKYNRPVVWTLHDCWAFTGHCCYFERVQCNKWKTQCGECPLQFLYPESIGKDNSRLNFERKRNAFQGVKNLTIVTVSNWLKEQVKQSFLNEYEIQTIYNGVDLNIFKPLDQNECKENLGYSGFKILLGVANEWSDGKGLHSFIEISKNISPDFKIVLVGVKESQKKILPDNIIAVDKTNTIEELVEYYSSADVFITPSIAETFGMVVAESLACGTPCVVNNTSALPELISNDVGKVINFNNVNDVINAIRDISKENKINYKSACTSKARRLFSIETHLSNYHNIYNKFI